MKRPTPKQNELKSSRLLPQQLSETQLNPFPEKLSPKLTDSENEELPTLARLRLYLYLTPVFGFFPALCSLYLRQGSRQEQEISRLSVTLALGWLVAYFLLGTGAMQTAEILSLRFMILNLLWSTGYFGLSLVLMVRVWQGKSVRLPGVSRISEGWVRDKLSQ